MLNENIKRIRKSKGLSQEELAIKLNVVRQTVSKWENGKCMPDYGIIQPLCAELGIGVSELMDGEEQPQDSIRAYDDGQILDLIKRTQALESQRTTLSGVILIVLGIAICALSFSFGGSDVKDFVSGVMLGISCVAMLAGVYIVGSSLARRS